MATLSSDGCRPSISRGNGCHCANSHNSITSRVQFTDKFAFSDSISADIADTFNCQHFDCDSCNTANFFRQRATIPAKSVQPQWSVLKSKPKFPTTLVTAASTTTILRSFDGQVSSAKRNRRGKQKFLLLRIFGNAYCSRICRLFAYFSPFILLFLALISTAKTSEYRNYNNSITHLHRSRRDGVVSAEALWDTPPGCATLQLCCAGQNHSCRASLAARAPARSRPKRLTKLFEFRADEPFPPVMTRRGSHRRRVGELILPDTVALDLRGAHYARMFGQKESLRVVALDKRLRNRRRRRHTDDDDYFIFGTEMEDPSTPHVVIFDRSRPIIRYSVLNKFLPLRIGKLTKMGDGGAANDNELLNKRLRVMYVTEAYADCYCDAQCVKYTDCCHDYVEFCRPILSQPYAYASWSRWTACLIAAPQTGVCGGEGVQTRTRKILHGSQNRASTRHEAVTQTRGCFAPCQRMRVAARVEQTVVSRPPDGTGASRSMIDMTAVALLLDYHYNESRMYRMSRPHDYYRYQTLALGSDQKHVDRQRSSQNATGTFRLLPTDDERFDPSHHIFYCVHYELGWVNRNCVERRYKSMLRRRNRICVECQPHAQLHQNEPRCASDLEDGDKGLWKLIGSPSCSGVWWRLSRTDNCTCASQFPRDAAFLMVLYSNIGSEYCENYL